MGRSLASESEYGICGDIVDQFVRQDVDVRVYTESCFGDIGVRKILF